MQDWTRPASYGQPVATGYKGCARTTSYRGATVRARQEREEPLCASPERRERIEAGSIGDSVSALPRSSAAERLLAVLVFEVEFDRERWLTHLRVLLDSRAPGQCCLSAALTTLLSSSARDRRHAVHRRR